MLAWVKKSAPFNVFRTIVSKGSDSCGLNESYALDTGPDGGLRFLAFQGGSSFAAVASALAPASIWNSQWHAVAGTFDGTTARLYLDGVQVGSAPAPVPGGGIHYGLPENRLSVGRFPQGSSVRSQRISVPGRGRRGAFVQPGAQLPRSRLSAGRRCDGAAEPPDPRRRTCAPSRSPRPPPSRTSARSCRSTAPHPSPTAAPRRATAGTSTATARPTRPAVPTHRRCHSRP